MSVFYAYKSFYPGFMFPTLRTMGRNKKWTGYTSWSYLTPGVDFDVYPLNKQIDRVPKYDFGLSKTQDERLEEILEKNIIIDLHDHINVYPENRSVIQRRPFKAYEGLAFSGIDVIFDNGGGTTYDSLVKHLGMSMCDYAHQDFFIPAQNIDDITRAFKEGKIAVVHAVETASAIDSDVDRLDVLYGLGLRSMGICYSNSNPLGSGLGEINDGGLTDFGYDAVKRMNKHGIIIDVAHAGDKTALDTIEVSDKPILVSHRGTRTLTNTTRMLPDNVLQTLAEKDGVIAVEVAGFGLRTEKSSEASIEGLLEHIEYLINVLGVDYVGAGPDTMFQDHAGMYRAPSRARGHHSRTHPQGPVIRHATWRVDVVRDLDYVKGLESASDFANIARGLIRDGYSDQEIAKVMGLNGLRLIKACWPR